MWLLVWSHPTGQAACVQKRAGEGVCTGRELRRERRRRGGEAVLGFAECKMTSNGPRSWFLSRVAVIRKTSEIESLCPPSTRHSTASYLKKKPNVFHQNMLHQTEMLLDIYLKRGGGKHNSQPANSTDCTPPMLSSRSFVASSQVLLLKWPLCGRAVRAPLPPAGRTVNGIL